MRRIGFKEARERVARLRKTIDHHRYLYHALDRQEISEAALDSLKHELYTLEQQYPQLITPTSPTQRVAGKSLEKFDKITHRYPMRSIEDVFTAQELEEWRARMAKRAGRLETDYYCELKMDGLAVSLVYEDGVFAYGATRGDGMVGENVSANLRTIEAIPLHLRVPTDREMHAFLEKHKGRVDRGPFFDRLSSLSGRIEVRGEVFMEKKAFEKLNIQHAKRGEPPFANPRNAAAGSIRQLDSQITAARTLSFFGYALMDEESFGITTHEQAHQILRMIGMKVNARDALCATLEEIREFYERIEKHRASLPYWTDGIVAVVNTNHLLERLGMAGKTPRGMIAYKFPAEQTTTILKAVAFQVGRTGALTPVATLQPVLLAGTTVSHATLHNIDEIKRLGLKVGDTVIIEKAGDIIPKIISIVKDLRPSHAHSIATPRHCPICGSAVHRRAGEVALYCSNKRCYAQEKEAIIHFVSKKAFDIEGLGEKIIEQLMQAGLVRSAADLFVLSVVDLEPLERFASKSAANLVQAIIARKHIDLARFLYSLGIRHVGEQTAIDLANHFHTYERVKSATLEQLCAVEHIGDVVAMSVYEYVRDERQRRHVEELFKNGVVITPWVVNRHTPLAEKTFVLTGTLASMTRDQAKEIIRSLGGIVSGSVSAHTDYVVAGKDPGSKHGTAKRVGVRILDEREFLALLKA